MTPERFTGRLDLLVELGYPVIALSDALERLYKGELEAATVAITIDDGWYSTYSRMVPELVRRKMPATIYLYTAYAETQTSVFSVALNYLFMTTAVRHFNASRLELLIGDAVFSGYTDLDDQLERDRLHSCLSSFAEKHLDAPERERLLEKVAKALGMDWRQKSSQRQFHLMSIDEARECARNGIDIQLHTHYHRCVDDGMICLEEEIYENRERLKLIGDSDKVHFCYPSGDWNQSYFSYLKAAGVVSATTTSAGMCTRGSEPLALPRLLDGDRVSDLEFEAELAGLMEIKRSLVRFLRSLARPQANP